MRKVSKRTYLLSLFIVLSLLISACAQQQPTVDSPAPIDPTPVVQEPAATPEPAPAPSEEPETPASNEPLYIYLTRHGQTITNVTHRMVSAHASSPLTAPGREVAYYVGIGLSGVPFKAAYCTEKSRTKETAQIILAESQTNPDLEIEVIPGMQEFCAGVFESKTFSYVMDEMGYLLSDENPQKMLIDQFPEGDTSGTAESWQEFHDRVLPAFKEVCEREASTGGGNILVVAHGGVNRMLGEVLSGETQPGAINSSVVLIEYLNGEFKVLAYNDTSAIDLGKEKVENPQPLNIHLVTHGDTLMDEFGWLNSIIDSPTTDAGFAQMDAVGKALANVELSAVYASDMFNDIECAQTIISNNKNPHLMVNATPDLRSVSLGFYEGAALDDEVVLAVEATMTSRTAKNIADAYAKADETATAEDYATAKKRIMESFEALCERAYTRGGGDVAVVAGSLTHQLIIEALSGSSEAVALENGSVVTVVFDGSKYTVQ
ncbi:histidine phosphatase family protein [Christensenellaceae bacterium OttesenSCG-928-M15]|nr:histidine phosphatase family protein [Christensenellaceae bacterium OttesenSCG-928-M15]